MPHFNFKALILSSSLALCACATSIESNRNEVFINKYHNNKAVPLYLGQTLTIDLPIDTSTDYKWIAAADPQAVVTQVGESNLRLLPNSINATDGASMMNTHYKAIKKGEQKLHLEYRRPWDNKSAIKHMYFDITVK